MPKFIDDDIGKSKRQLTFKVGDHVRTKYRYRSQTSYMLTKYIDIGVVTKKSYRRDHEGTFHMFSTYENNETICRNKHFIKCNTDCINLKYCFPKTINKSRKFIARLYNSIHHYPTKDIDVFKTCKLKCSDEWIEKGGLPFIATMLYRDSQPNIIVIDACAGRHKIRINKKWVQLIEK